MRSKNVIKSSVWQLIYQIVIMVLGFLVPRFIIVVYGSEVNGLQSTFIQIINVMTLLNAGAISASVYELYKPFEKKDYKVIAMFLDTATKYFRKTGYVFLLVMFSGAVIVSYSLDYTFKQHEIILAFTILGFKSAMDIIYTSKYRIVFMADQKRHLTSIGMLIEYVVYYVLLFIVLKNNMHFILMYWCLLIGTIMKIAFYKLKFDEKYNYLPTLKGKKDKNSIVNKNYAMVNEISHTAVTGTISVLISYMYSLVQASVFSIYALVNTAITVFANILFNSFAPSYGSLVASGDYKRSMEVFRIFYFVFTMFNTLLYMCVAYLIVPFVGIYTSDITEVEYINNLLGALICIYGIVFTYRIPFNIVVSTNGLFKETWKQPLVCGALSFLLSFLGGKISMPLILIGPIFFYACNFIYQYLVTVKRGVIDCGKFIIKDTFISISCIVLALYFSTVSPSNADTFKEWIGISIQTMLVSTFIIAILVWVFDRKNLKDTINYSKTLAK